MAISNIDNVKTGIETDINNGVPLIDGNTVRDNMVDTLESVNAASGILFEYVASVGDLASGKFTMLENDGTTVTNNPADCEYFAFYENDLASANVEPLIGLDDFAIYMRSTGGYYAMMNASNMIASTDTVLSCEVISPKTVGVIAVDEVVKFEFLNKYDSGVTADLQTVLDNGSTADVSAPIVVTTSGNNDIDIYTNDSGDLNVGAVGTGDARLEAVDGEVRVRSLNSGVVIDGGVGVDIGSGTGNVNINGNKAQTAQSGTTANRPSTPVIGESYFDTDKGYRIDYNGANWVNASGAIV